ncbi:MAG: transcriptional regulator [Dehalococcoidales bacterium]|nr:transcriptional regulator [Dehalococcoidales bacterium]
MSADGKRKATASRGSELGEGYRDLAHVDRIVHEPSRLIIMALLFPLEHADFLFLLHETGLTKGNLSAHLSRLEEAGYVAIEKTFRGKVPQTICHLTEDGRTAFRDYRERLKRAVESMPE